MKSMRREQGFTLIELMIVVAIIAIIAAIAIPSLLNARKAGSPSPGHLLTENLNAGLLQEHQVPLQTKIQSRFLNLALCRRN